jgi:hypothetical protein
MRPRNRDALMVFENFTKIDCYVSVRYGKVLICCMFQKAGGTRGWKDRLVGWRLIHRIF